MVDILTDILENTKTLPKVGCENQKNRYHDIYAQLCVSIRKIYSLILDYDYCICIHACVNIIAS